MHYIAIIHKGEGTAYGVTLPDFPGCFSAADTLDDVPRNVQEAVELWAEGEEVAPPVPSSFEEVARSEAARGGCSCWWTSPLTSLTQTSCRSTFPCLSTCVTVSTGRHGIGA